MNTRKLVSRYNISHNTWEIGYYICRRFVVVSILPHPEYNED